MSDVTVKFAQGMQSVFIPLDHPLLVSCIFVLLALLPLLVLSVTSYIKLNIVFGVLRSAFGAGQIPSGAITSLLALVLSFYIMAPIGKEMYAQAAGKLIQDHSIVEQRDRGLMIRWGELMQVIDAAKTPLESFLKKHSRQKERLFFASRQAELSGANNEKLVACANKSDNPEVCEINNESFISLVPAFLISEIKDAFRIGFIVFLPFLVIDLVVTNILAALGMMMVSPPTIAFPIKIILFVASDAWYLLCRSLIVGYA